ncbi:hypothetical protein CIHG_01640 [Coccidioides immitis H538.4]|uniref:Uncharacterized protein n=2 Tax=Coccidioides immitis TaxID=5501 RepID=A0A0J8RGU2_COCIT|nr:hypothetical protein CIRG_01491 [Coccidioides immitis RMSCC 2394]KMU83856.1 hypothetical protein CIHG_01640 [Coccidioides immitis H538.4]
MASSKRMLLLSGRPLASVIHLIPSTPSKLPFVAGLISSPAVGCLLAVLAAFAGPRTPGYTRSPPIPTARQACPKHPHIWIDVGDIPANSPPVAKIMAVTANAARHSLGGLGHEYERIPNSGTS